jgi:hypothetical protein
MIDREGADIKSAFDLGGIYGEFDDAFNIEIDMIEIDTLSDGEDIKFAENVNKEKLCIYERISE